MILSVAAKRFLNVGVFKINQEMKTAKEYLIERIGEDQYDKNLVRAGIEGFVIAAIMNAEKEAIEECAERVQIDYNGLDISIDKKSILSLIDELK